MDNLTRIKIGAAGEHLSADAPEFSAIYFPQLGFMVGSHSRGIAGKLAAEDEPGSPADLQQAFAGLDLAGATGWTLSDDFQTQLAADRRRDPCIDTDNFPGVVAKLHWTSSPCPWSAAASFGVHFALGSVYYDYLHGYGRGFGLPVRVVGQ